jgi:hypothetical protein
MNARVGIAWFKASEWDRLRQVSSDSERLERSHREWLRQARKGLSQLRRLGLVCERVPVGVDELVEWCRERGIPVNAEARAEFAALKIRQSDFAPKGNPG